MRTPYRFLILILVLAAGGMLVAPNPALAAAFPVSTGGAGGPAASSVGGAAQDQPGVDITIQQIRNAIITLVCWTTQIAIFIIVFFVLFYGWLFFKSQGNPTKTGEAWKALRYGLLGIIVILGAYTIIATVTNALGGKANPIPINCSSVAFLGTLPAHAATAQDLPPGQAIELGDVTDFIITIVRALLGLAGVVSAGFIVWAGITRMMAGSNTTKLTEAAARFKAGLIGAAIVFAVFVIIGTIENIVNRTFF